MLVVHIGRTVGNIALFMYHSDFRRFAKIHRFVADVERYDDFVQCENASWHSREKNLMKVLSTTSSTIATVAKLSTECCK